MSCPKFTQLFVSARKMKAQALLHGKRSNISQWHFGCFHLHSYRQQQIYCRVCNRICLIPYIWFLMRILDFGKCNPFGTAKAGERFAKELRKGGSWELLFSTTFIYLPSCELTYPHPRYVLDDVLFPKVGYVSSLEGRFYTIHDICI